MIDRQSDKCALIVMSVDKWATKISVEVIIFVGRPGSSTLLAYESSDSLRG
jgi:hypothetical protein